jgi:hypothetical protein
MSEEENDLDDCDEGYESLSAEHVPLDSERLRRDSGKEWGQKGRFSLHRPQKTGSFRVRYLLIG